MWLAVIVLALRSAVISAVLSTSSVMNSWRALPACRASVVRLCAAHESSSEKGKRAPCRYESRTVVRQRQHTTGEPHGRTLTQHHRHLLWHLADVLIALHDFLDAALQSVHQKGRCSSIVLRR